MSVFKIALLLGISPLFPSQSLFWEHHRVQQVLFYLRSRFEPNPTTIDCSVGGENLIFILFCWGDRVFPKLVGKPSQTHYLVHSDPPLESEYEGSADQRKRRHDAVFPRNSFIFSELRTSLRYSDQVPYCNLWLTRTTDKQGITDSQLDRNWPSVGLKLTVSWIKTDSQSNQDWHQNCLFFCQILTIKTHNWH